MPKLAYERKPDPEVREKRKVIAFSLIGDNEIEILRALGKDAAGKGGLLYVLDMMREFGHSGSSIDTIGHGMFVLKTEDSGDDKKIVGVDFVPHELWREKSFLDAERGHYKFLGAEALIRGMVARIFERIKQAGSDRAKQNYLTRQKEDLAAVNKYYPDERGGIIEFDYIPSLNELRNCKYQAKNISYGGKIIE